MRISDWSSDVCSSDLDPEHESDGHAEQQRREEHAGEVDLADHDAGIHDGARSNSAMRSPASERIARVTGLLFWLSRLGHSWLSATSTRASSRGDGWASSNSLPNRTSPRPVANIGRAAWRAR